LTLVLAVLEDPTNETETVSDRVGFQITLFRRIATLASSTQTQLPHSEEFARIEQALHSEIPGLSSSQDEGLNQEGLQASDIEWICQADDDSLSETEGLFLQWFPSTRQSIFNA
ncbi:MAG: hypothetical protein AAFP90_15950, partial [Planctomycetota bacterium]